MRYIHDKTKDRYRFFIYGSGKHYVKKPNMHGRTQPHMPINARDKDGNMILPRNKFIHN